MRWYFLRRTLGGLVVLPYVVPRWLGDWHGPFWGFHLRDRRLTVVLSTLTPWVEGLVARGGRTGRSSPLGTHGNGTVWRGEITGGLTRGFAIAPSRVLNNKVELGG
jgi:hypothetical protein